MRDASRNVRHISRVQLEFESGISQLVYLGVERLALQRQFKRRSENSPALRTLHLQHKNIVRIVMRLGALCVWGRHVNVSLERATQFAFDATAEFRERWNQRVQKRQRHCRTFFKQ